MCASIAWYGTTPDSADEIKVGPVSFTLAGVYVGLMSSAMTFPINILIVLIFRMARPPPQKNEVKSEEIRKKEVEADDVVDSKPDSEKPWWEDDDEPEYFVEDELKKQQEFLETGNLHKRNLTKCGKMTEEDAGLVQVANIPLPKDLMVRA